MKKKMLTLALALIMVLSLLAPAYAAETGVSSDIAAVISSSSDTDVITADMLKELYKLVDGAEAPVTASKEDVVVFLLRWAGLKDSQLSADKAGSEQFAYDCTELAKSLDLFKGVTYRSDSQCTVGELKTMLANVQPLYEALHADKLTPLFVNGMAQPIFPYTSGIPAEGATYSNADSDIIRFCVWVETNYDTDGDGKLDLVKALVQLPKAAAEGDYKAATLYEARPYITGCTDAELPYVEGGYDIAAMYSTPAARVAAGKSTTAEQAAKAKSEDWYYWNPYENIYDFEDLTWYDYYLVRGFAVVECGGLGTKDSEGFETCGTDLEIDAFKCVIEWLHGDRVAYTDMTSNIAIEADWSSGKVGMTGRSYAGTTQFGLATTGVKGLETIIPVAGIASWYEYTNSQGVSTNRDTAYSDWLAMYCAGRYLDDADYATIKDSYGKYLQQIRDIQRGLNGDYGEHWAIRDYTVDPLLDWEGIKIPALIVHGLNDTNVRTKESDLMYKSFVKAGQNVKLLLHQGTHLTPTYPAQEYALKINGEYYDSILNKWLSHYLCGVNNGIEKMANVTLQSNVNGSWTTWNSWDTSNKSVLQLAQAATATETAVSGGKSHTVVNDEGRNETVVDVEPVSAKYTFSVPADVTVQGAVAVHLRASAKATGGKALSELDGIRMTVGLNDTNGSEFNAYVPERSYLPITSKENKEAWMGGGVENFALVEYTQTPTASKSIGLGYIDVFNPTAGYDSASAAKRTELVEGQYYDYTVYIQPTAYTVKAGHTLELTVDLITNSDLELTIDRAGSYVELPTHSKVNLSAPQVQLSSQSVSVQGKAVAAEVYNIDGYNYFKLRDVAAMLAGTNSQFSVDYDEAARAVSARSGETYTATGDELKVGEDKSATCVVSSQSVIVNGETLNVTVYNIGGNNFFKLRDLGEALNFGVGYDEATGTVYVGTQK